MLLGLIEPDALLYAIRMSGGVMRELIWIVRTSHCKHCYKAFNNLIKGIIIDYITQPVIHARVMGFAL